MISSSLPHLLLLLLVVVVVVVAVVLLLLLHPIQLPLPPMQRSPFDHFSRQNPHQSTAAQDSTHTRLHNRS